MLQTRRNNRLRTLVIEKLEDRTLLTGKITAVETAGVLTISGQDNLNHAYEILRHDSMLAVHAAGGTFINGMKDATVNFSIPNTLTINEPFDGNNEVTIHEFTVPNLNAQFGNGNNSLEIENVITQTMMARLGTGNNEVTIHKFQSQGPVTLIVGTETPGAQGSNSIVAQQSIFGALTLKVLDESGVSGILEAGGAGMRPPASPLPPTRPQIHINRLAMEDDQILGSLGLRVDDGDFYPNGLGSSSLEMSDIDAGTIDNAPKPGIDLGDHFGLVELEQIHVRNGNITLTAENDLGEVSLEETRIAGREVVILGDNAPYLSTFPSVMINEATIGTDLTLLLGSNINRAERHGEPVDIKDATIGKNLTTGPSPVAASMNDNGLALAVDPTSVGGTITMTMGNGGLNAFESLSLVAVASTDPDIYIHSNAGDLVDLSFEHVLVTDPNPPGGVGFLLSDSGHGVDHVVFTDVTVVAQLFVALSDSGHNFFEAKNLKVAPNSMVFIGFGGTYVNNGSNSGFMVFPFLPEQG